MIRQLLVTVAIAFLTIGTFLGLPLSAMAATQDYSSNKQESQSYPSQSEYDKKQTSSDYSYSYTDKQKNQAKTQEKQSNQADANKKQYAQQEQSYQKK